jgi:hypothetical protein
MMDGCLVVKELRMCTSSRRTTSVKLIKSTAWRLQQTITLIDRRMEEQFCFLNDEPRATTKVDRDGTSAGRSSRRSDGRVKTLALPWRAHHYIIEIIDPSFFFWQVWSIFEKKGCWCFGGHWAIWNRLARVSLLRREQTDARLRLATECSCCSI